MNANSIEVVPVLVSVHWLLDYQNYKDITVLDLRDRLSYCQNHIAGAVQSGYEHAGWRVQCGNVSGLVPEQSILEQKIGKLGITPNTHVIFVCRGLSANEMAGAARMYWTFRLLGHKCLSILEGGMAAYMSCKDNAPLEKGEGSWKETTYKTSSKTMILADKIDVLKALKRGTPLLDSRPRDQYLGIERTTAVLRYGTLPGAVGIAAQWLTKQGCGNMCAPETLHRLYKSVGADPGRSAILFCNTGHWASLGWFVHSEILGNRDSMMYDASMAEWSRLDETLYPMEVKASRHNGI